MQNNHDPKLRRARGVLPWLIAGCLLCLTLTACGSSEVHLPREEMPDGPAKTNGLAFLETKPESSIGLDDRDGLHGIVISERFDSGGINSDSWNAMLLLADGTVVTLGALNDDARKYEQVVAPGDYVLAKPDGMGKVWRNDLQVLQQNAVVIPTR